MPGNALAAGTTHIKWQKYKMNADSEKYNQENKVRYWQGRGLDGGLGEGFTVEGTFVLRPE